MAEAIDPKKATMHFCKECNNMLRPTVFKDRENNETKLVYICRNCKDKIEDPEDYCVYRNEVKISLDERIPVIPEIASDVTLSRSKNVLCSRCGGNEAVFFIQIMGREEKLVLFYYCTNVSCGHRWRDKK